MAKSLLFKPLLLISLFFFCKTSAQAQNYFYGSYKFPVIEYLIDLSYQRKDVNGQLINNPYEETAGMILDGGFGFKVLDRFYIETGVNYLFVNTNVEHDKKSGNTLTIKNYVVGAQIRPTYKQVISMDNDVFLNVGCGFNYQKINSNGYYQNYFIDSNNFESSALSHDKTQSSYYVNVQPYLGIDFKKNKKIGFRLGVTYNHQNYNRSEKKLRFSNDPKLIIAPHKRGNVFMVLGMIF